MAQLPRMTRRLREQLDFALYEAWLYGFHHIDYRWLESKSDTCPVCGQTGILPGAIGTLSLPNCGMTVIPYIMCQRCATQEMDQETGDFTDEASARTAARVLKELGLNPGPTLIEKVSWNLMAELERLVMQIAEEEMPVNLWWLHERTHECPACRKTFEKPGRVSNVVLNIDGVHVVVPYVLCPECAGLDREEEVKRVESVVDVMVYGNGEAPSVPASRQPQGKVIPFRRDPAPEY